MKQAWRGGALLGTMMKRCGGFFMGFFCELCMEALKAEDGSTYPRPASCSAQETKIKKNNINVRLECSKDV